MKKWKILLPLSLVAILSACALAFAGCKPRLPSSDCRLRHGSFQWVTDKESNCTEAGSKHKECTDCGELLEKKIISPKGHRFVENVCSVCGVTASEGLAYELLPGGSEYSVVGIGSCADKDVVIPSSHQNLPVTEIRYGAFANCDITGVALPDSVKKIGDTSFRNCLGLTNIIIPDSVTFIGNSAFSCCSGLASIIVPDKVTSLGNSVFSVCRGLTDIFLPDGLTSIGEAAFQGCSSLTSITLPDGVTSIGNGAFDRCSSLTNITLPDGVTAIDGAFSGCTNLTSITLPDSLTSIGRFAFFSCASLTSVTLPDNVMLIGVYAFSDCRNMTSVFIPDGVISIGDKAFDNCLALTAVYYKGTKAKWDEIIVNSGNEDLQSATIYYYSETTPPLTADGTAYDGNYWRYAADGKTPVIWKKPTA